MPFHRFHLVPCIKPSSRRSERKEAESEFPMSYSRLCRERDPVGRQDSDSNEKGRTTKFDKVAWTEYETVHQKYLLIGLKPKIRDHYRAHRLSFWLNLIPQLHRPGTASMQPQHHLLEDHNNPLTYDGVVRSLGDGDNVSAGPFLAGPMAFSTVNPASVKNSTLMNSSTTMEPTQRAPNDLPGTTDDDFLDSNETRPLTIQETAALINYSTALSVIIGVGASLLILNILIFAGLYYQRDKNRMEMKLQKRRLQEAQAYGTDGDEPIDEEAFNHQTHGDSDKDSNIDRDKFNLWEFEVRRPGDHDSMVLPGQSKPGVAGASAPLAICPPTLPPEYPHHHHHNIHPTQQGVRMLPPKVPPKPVMVPAAPTDNAIPEAQPLLPTCGILKQNPAPPQQTQEMPV
ncbi:neuroligin-4, X-linked [Trichonephila inaurata madagascariensis]|uniref:Neuroligin-4, X-linked n=1 Tax=Trichonephila inaurata madagascariensis TaxID=2747483 RepID=A0A8X7CJ49_9ARAC|nr:neuroligin-4, X-linked [Trichonephila inaurata madagascariensis]